jgi:hypothetical protein
MRGGGGGAPVPGGQPTPDTPAAPDAAPAPTSGTDDVSRTHRIDALATYFRLHRATYAEASLRRAALDAGYEVRDVDAAWAVTAEPAPVRGRAGGVPALVTIGYLVVSFGATAIAAAVPDTSGLAILVPAVALVAGIAAWLALRGTHPAIAQGLRMGVILAIVLPVVIGLVVLGVCLVVVLGGRSLTG